MKPLSDFLINILFPDEPLIDDHHHPQAAPGSSGRTAPTSTTSTQKTGPTTSAHQMIFPDVTTADLSEFMDDLHANGQQLQDQEPKTIYYIQAFIGNKAQWDEYAMDEEERDALVKQAIDAGFTFIVETELY
jgi:hypothetical protein